MNNPPLKFQRVELVDEDIEKLAEFAHEVNKHYCRALGDLTQHDWAFTPDWQRESCNLGVRGALEGITAQESHERWMKHKTETGWTYGKVKDVDAKEHPCMVPYEDMPLVQQLKDRLFLHSVTLLAEALIENRKY